MQTREYKCFTKILNVCKNRGLGDLADEIISKVGTKYLKKGEIRELSGGLPKHVKYSDKISFLDAAAFSNICTKCQADVEKGDASFIRGKALYHVLCGLDALGDDASSNFYYRRWAAQSKKSDHE